MGFWDRLRGKRANSILDEDERKELESTKEALRRWKRKNEAET